MSVSFLFKLNDKNIIYTSDIGNKEYLYLFKDLDSEIFISEITHISLAEIEQFELV
ncbi:MAG: hypothetical protein KDC52_17480 [Ignavibacteriae bacterium]|nr:hypothetical protein [Ignavibacteriota bacterium]MCB9211648.1 hypothetical protein [Ignavibacteriales bacterium]MCB9220102.1 hypothetical protein [Ignavibacteriales bacterium]